MASLVSELRHKSWRKDRYLISTDYTLIPAKAVNEAFASDRVYWAKPVPEDEMRVMLEHSLCFGLYVTKEASSDLGSTSTSTPKDALGLEFIGLARCMTDFVTFVYITDVFIDPSQSGTGLGRWMMSCIREVTDAMPHLRRTLLFTGDWKRSVPFYEETLGMAVMQSKKGADGRSGEGVAVMERRGKGNPLYVEEDS